MSDATTSAPIRQSGQCFNCGSWSVVRHPPGLNHEGGSECTVCAAQWHGPFILPPVSGGVDTFSIKLRYGLYHE